MNHSFDLDFPRACGGVVCVAGFRCFAEDFLVEETPGFTFSGEGEHVCLYIEKTGLATREVTQALAAFAGLDTEAVGYFGLKDKHAVTRQWFSLQLPGRDADFSAFSLPGTTLLETARHRRKLRRGEHEANAFRIRLRDVDGDPLMIEKRLQQLVAGVPNYFGEQRFGVNANNLHEAEKLFTRRRGKRLGFTQRMLVSAARSWLFNLVLAERVRQGNWHVALEGESAPQGPLWGRGRSPASTAVAALEQEVLSPWCSWCEWLEYCGLSQERRDLVLKPFDLGWQWQQKDLLLEFSLPAGQFATALLRELAEYRVAA